MPTILTSPAGMDIEQITKDYLADYGRRQQTFTAAERQKKFDNLLGYHGIAASNAEARNKLALEVASALPPGFQTRMPAKNISTTIWWPDTFGLLWYDVQPYLAEGKTIRQACAALLKTSFWHGVMAHSYRARKKGIRERTPNPESLAKYYREAEKSDFIRFYKAIISSPAGLPQSIDKNQFFIGLAQTLAGRTGKLIHPLLNL